MFIASILGEIRGATLFGSYKVVTMNIAFLASSCSRSPRSPSFSRPFSLSLSRSPMAVIFVGVGPLMLCVRVVLAVLVVTMFGVA